MLTPDDGSPLPPLPDDAGPHERTLYGIYGFATGLVSWTADDWGTTADSVRGLATDVRAVVRALQGADEPWAGPAADGAYASLGRLARALDARATEIDDIKRGLTKAADSGTTARIAYSTEVRSLSTSVERSPFESTPARPPGGVPVPDGTVFDRAAYDRAVSAARAEREAAALTVLTTFGENMGDAAKQLPVDPVTDPVRIDPGSGPGGGSGGGAPGGPVPSGGGYQPPSGGTGLAPGTGSTEYTGSPQHTGTQQTLQPHQPDPTTTQQPTPIPPTPTPTPTPVPTGVGPGPEVTLDGPTTGSTSPGGGASALPGTTPAPAPGSAGIGGAATAMGGMLAGGGAAAVLGRGGLAGGAGRATLLPGAAGTPGSAAARAGSTAGTGAASRGGAAGAVGQGSAGRSSVVGAAGQGSAGRGSGGVGGRGGATRTGRYGVPKLDSSGRGARAVPAGGGAGSRGARRDDRRDPRDVDRLTSEDEDTWFDGEDDATPPVWR